MIGISVLRSNVLEDVHKVQKQSRTGKPDHDTHID